MKETDAFLWIISFCDWRVILKFQKILMHKTKFVDFKYDLKYLLRCIPSAVK